MLKRTHLLLAPQILSLMKRHLCLQLTKIRVFKIHYLLLFLPLVVFPLPSRPLRNTKTRLLRLKSLKKKKKIKH
ncbi:hypothetical protein BCV72DRAFT_94951 [Rhizopus microsporus var. microsporus]|uniref:Uncharacterized protein n=1 Tax=Rhizopus microsporus var. microsporus TaxID=86635 RepID=A0A1X0RHX7_RHIZD|nr:hypothetical protein BCV72DRAFT_94951 [Rhizopus microsporus var. microsporus]